MKTLFLTILFYLAVFSTNAQIEPLLEPDYWTTEKIEIDGETTYADTNNINDYEKLFIDGSESSASGGLEFVTLTSGLIFDDDNQ
ncbi:MAG: hypothetical protein ACQESK_11050, partial [Bacteroidota bacterium]